MSKQRIKRVIDRLTEEWRIPKTPARVIAKDSTVSFLTQCTAERSDETIVDSTVPADVLDFWSLYQRADLFIEIDDHFEGLRLLGNKEAYDETELFKNGEYAEYLHKEGDLVLGKFVNLDDLLIVRCDSKAADFGNVLVAIYDGKRDEWYEVENTFADFLERYAEAEGAHYWEEEDDTPSLPAVKDW